MLSGPLEQIEISSVSEYHPLDMVAIASLAIPETVIVTFLATTAGTVVAAILVAALMAVSSNAYYSICFYHTP